MKPDDYHQTIIEKSNMEIKLKRNCIDDGVLIDGKLAIFDQHDEILYHLSMVAGKK